MSENQFSGKTYFYTIASRPHPQEQREGALRGAPQGGHHFHQERMPRRRRRPLAAHQGHSRDPHHHHRVQRWDIVHDSTLLGVPSWVRFCQQEFGEFPRPPWAVGSYSSGPPAGGTTQILVDKTSSMSGRLRVYNRTRC